MDFQWDSAKAASNLKKHGVSFPEAATIFSDPLALTFNDPDHSISEHRLLTFGLTQTGRHIVVSHTELGTAIRIISARPMARQEKAIYEEE